MPVLQRARTGEVMRGRRRKATMSIDLDALILGGHNFEQQPDHEDDADYTYTCTHCHGTVSGWAIDEGLWPAVVGRYCGALLLGVSP